MPSEDCPWWEYAACRALLTRWSRRPGWYTAYDYATEEFVFQVPGESEPRRFRPFVVHTERGPVKRWAVGPRAGL